METKFFLPGTVTDKGYENVRDLEHNKDLRVFVEELWSEYHYLSDRHFLEDAKTHFCERFWEMYLGVTLIRRGYDLKPMGNNAPDFCVMRDTGPIYIEATAPGPGTGTDAVPEAPLDIASYVPEDRIILRLRSAIEDKRKQYDRWLTQSKVEPDKPFIIAVNGRRIRSAISEGVVPFIIKTVFPFGDYAVALDRSTMEVTDSYNVYRDTIKKASGAGIKTDLFYSDDYRQISAVLYANYDYANHAINLGDEFTLVHNPKASYPIAEGLFPFGKEYTSDRECLNCKKW